MNPLLIAIIIASILIVVYIVIRVVILKKVYRAVFVNPFKGKESPYYLADNPQFNAVKDKVKKHVDEFINIPFEWVETKSFDGLVLKGRLYEGDPAKPVIICFHGYKGIAMREASFSIRLNQLYNFNIIVVDHRGHGISEGETISFGAFEQKDVISWIEFVKKRFGSDVLIGTCGVSMGAATVLLASGREDYPSNVRGIVADCPYSSGKDIICTVIKRAKAPVAICYFGVMRAAYRLGKFKLMPDTDVVKAVKKSKTPVLLIHGEADMFVPCYMSEKIHNANPKLITYSSFPKAGHGLSYIIDPVRYQNEVIDFWKRVMPEAF